MNQDADNPSYDDEHVLARTVVSLPGMFADQLFEEDLAAVREYADVGEWEEAVDLLIACLQLADAEVTEHQTTLLTALADHLRLQRRLP